MTPFAVSKKRKTLYLHIAKTGGSSIIKILRQNGLDDGILSGKKVPYEKKLEEFEKIVDQWEMRKRSAYMDIGERTRVETTRTLERPILMGGFSGETTMIRRCYADLCAVEV
jgi:hypothetical protein